MHLAHPIVAVTHHYINRPVNLALREQYGSIVPVHDVGGVRHDPTIRENDWYRTST